uniref:hypothetical protein n=1 Tax=uncultured Dysosmobacter sp. TaxID=2591384 RepID=UPI00262C2DD1
LDEDGGLIASNVRMLDKDEIYVQTLTPDRVYTQDTKSKDVYKDLGATVCNEARNSPRYTWTAFVNGQRVDSPVLPDSDDGDKYIYTNKGTQTEIYIDDADQTVRVVEINYYIGQVSKVKSDEDGEYIIVRTLSDGAAQLNDKTFYAEGWSEDDYVIFTIDYVEADDEFIIREVMAPTEVTGVVQRVQNDTANLADNVTGKTYLVMDGEKYTYSAGVEADPGRQEHMIYDVDDTTAPKHPTLDEEYVIYLDPLGYVVAYDKVEAESNQYLYVEDSDEELRDWVARVILTDATNPKVDVNRTLSGAITKPLVQFNRTTNEFDAYTSDVDSTTTVGENIKWVINKDTAGNNLTNIDTLIWKYSVNSSGVYKLTYIDPMAADKLTKAEVQSAWEDAEIHNGKAFIELGKDNLIVDKKTVFVDTINDKVYTGYDEVPNVEDADIAFVTKNYVAKVVFILRGNIYDAASTYFVLNGSSRVSLKYDGDEYWEYDKAYVNGEKTTLTVKYRADKANPDTYLKSVGAESAAGYPVVYQIRKTTGDGAYITEVEKIVPTTEDKLIPYAMADGAFWAATADHGPAPVTGGTGMRAEDKYTFDDDTVFVVIERTEKKDGSGWDWSVFTGDVNDMNDDGASFDVEYVQVLKAGGADKDEAELVYIYRTSRATSSSGSRPAAPTGDFDAVTPIAGGGFEVRYYDEDGSMTPQEIKAYGMQVMSGYVGATAKSYGYIVDNTNYPMVFNDGSLFGSSVQVKMVPVHALKLDGRIVDYFDEGNGTNTYWDEDNYELADGAYIVGKVPQNAADITVEDGGPTYATRASVAAASQGLITDDEDIELWTAYKVALRTVTGNYTNDKGEQAALTTNCYVAAGTVVTLTSGSVDAKWHQFTATVDGETTNIGNAQYVESGTRTGVTYTVKADVVLGETTGWKFTIAGKDYGVHAKDDELYFDAPVKGAEYAYAKNVNADGLASAAITTGLDNTGTSYCYTVQSDERSNATDGVVELVQVVTITSTGASDVNITYNKTVVGGDPAAAVSNGNVFKVGTTLTVKEARAEGSHKITIQRDSGTAEDLILTTGTDAVSIEYKLKNTDYKLTFAKTDA